jgi:RNA polymerase sigma-70 factor (ECF subfamily)
MCSEHEMTDAAADSEETRHLLEQAQAGDPQAFDRLFDSYRPALKEMVALRLDRRLHGRLDASDVVQETHLVVLRRLPDYLKRRPMPFHLWLRKTAYERLLNLHRDHAGTARRAVEREVPLPDHSSVELARRLLAGGSSPSTAAARRELSAQIRQALAVLPPTDRELLVMRYLEHLSNAEIGLLLDLEPATVSKRHGRALLRLEKILRAMGLSESER